ncbi:hypothetical protein APUTEX25_000846, partial [Auxenochlorella protothecoides]
MTSLPALLRTHSASSLLHSMLQALGASSGTAGTPAAWTHLASLLEHPALPATETLPLSLVPSLTAALESHEPGALAAGRIVTCLVAKFEGRYHPGLDSTAALVAALWAAGDRGVQDAEAAEQLGLEGALSLVQAAVVSSNNSKKVSSVLLSKLLRPLCEMAFAPPGSAAACEQVRRSARGLLRAALFDPGLLPAISDWASAEAKTSGFAAVDERVGAGASSAKARSVPESDRPGPGFKRSTTFKDLSRRLRDLLGSQGLGPDLAAQTLVWMLSEYSHAVLGSSGRGDAGHRGSAHAKGGREAVVVPFTFYAALIGICWGTPDHALGPLAALTASLGPSGAYQPSQDASRAQRGLLCALGSTVLGLPPARDEGSPPPRAVLPVLTALLGVEHGAAPLGQSAPGAWVARCASALLAPEPDAKLAGTGHAARGSAPEAVVVERCTLLRLLESLVARPRLLHFEPRLLSLVLEAVIGPCACPAPPSLGAPLGAQAALLAAELGQLLPLLVATCRALLTRCATLWVIAGDGASRGAAHAAAAVMEQLAGIESIGAYLPQLLVDFIILVAADPSRAAWATLQVEPRALPCPLRSSGTGLALRDGAFALYGACSPKELQFLYLLLGRPPHAAEWREALTQLRTDYESMYKYSGKIFAVQKTLIQAWSIVTEAFVDPHFNAVAWDAELASALAAASAAPSPEAAAEALPSLLGKLGDRFTRWVPAREYADFRVASDGELQGVGLLIASDPVSGHLVVLAPIAGSPADRAGIRPGDEVERVDGAPTDGWDDARAARSLRGAGGSAVSVGIARRLDNGGAGSPGPRDIVPGVPAAPAGSAAAAAMEHRTLRLRRERLELSPVYAAAMHGEDDRTYGYIRLAAFSQHAAADMLRALGTLGRDGVDGYILDLRNNPGGLVNAAMDVAGLWLDPRAHPVVLRIQDRGTGGDLVGRARGGAAAAEIASAPQVSEKAVVLDGDRGPAVSAPLVVLVNRQSASASEILASALQDNGRATVIGEPTFGKGKIQSVYELGDGSALFVTVAKYKTASGLEIDGMGVMPSQTCRPIGSSQPTSPGIPIGPGADARVMEEAAADTSLDMAAAASTWAEVRRNLRRAACSHHQVAALPGQDVRADSLPAFFAALPGDNPTLPAGPLRLLEAAASVNPASQLSLASGEALAAWMALLHDWLLFQATTPSAPPGVREQAGAALTGACSALVAAAARSPALAAVALEAPAPLEAHATPDCAARLVACILCAAAEPRSPCHDAALALLQGPDAGLSGALGAGLAPALAAQLLRALPAGGEGLDSPRWAQAVASLLADSGEGAPAVHMAELRGMLRILGLLRAIPESHAADVAAVLVSVLACLLATVPGGEALQAGSAASEEASDLVPSVLNTLQACCACDPGLPCTLEWRGWLPPLAAALAGRACTDQVVALAAACLGALEACCDLLADLSLPARLAAGSLPGGRRLVPDESAAPLLEALPGLAARQLARAAASAAGEDGDALEAGCRCLAPLTTGLVASSGLARAGTTDAHFA